MYMTSLSFNMLEKGSNTKRNKRIMDGEVTVASLAP